MLKTTSAFVACPATRSVWADLQGGGIVSMTFRPDTANLEVRGPDRSWIMPLPTWIFTHVQADIMLQACRLALACLQVEAIELSVDTVREALKGGVTI